MMWPGVPALPACAGGDHDRAVPGANQGNEKVTQLSAKHDDEVPGDATAADGRAGLLEGARQ
jgi:hypothetical protein